MSRSFGWTLVVLGGLMVLAGLLALSGGLSWFGRLPGDVRVEGERVRFYAPIVSMLIVSAVVSLLLYLLRRLFSQ